MADDFVYPILVEEVDTAAGRPGQAASGPNGQGSIARVVDSAIRQTLAWRPQVDNPKAFIAALKNSFTIEPFQNRVDVRWTPRSYATTIDAQLGAITGAQASLLSRAKVELEASRPLLKGLTPLGSNVNNEYVDSVRVVIDKTLDEILREFANPDGPRLPRVDQLFIRLFGQIPPQRDPLGLPTAGHLHNLALQLGLQLGRVNNLAQEETFTNYLIVCDYLISLYESWQRYSNFVRGGRNQDTWLGTGLVRARRLLLVMAESVQETRFVMNSVFVGPEERAAIRFGRNGLSIEGLLDWTGETASDHGPALLQDAGKAGAETLAAMIDALRSEYDNLIQLIDQDRDLDTALNDRVYTFKGSANTSDIATEEELAANVDLRAGRGSVTIGGTANLQTSRPAVGARRRQLPRAVSDGRVYRAVEELRRYLDDLSTTLGTIDDTPVDHSPAIIDLTAEPREVRTLVTHDHRKDNRSPSYTGRPHF